MQLGFDLLWWGWKQCRKAITYISHVKKKKKKKQYSDLLKEATIQEIVGLFMVAGWEGGRAFGWAFSSELNHRLEI